MTWHEPPLFDGWDPSLVRPPALWPTVDPLEVGLDEQARWIWPDAVGSGDGAGWSPSLSSWSDQDALPGISEGWSA